MNLVPTDFWQRPNIQTREKMTSSRVDAGQMGKSWALSLTLHETQLQVCQVPQPKTWYSHFNRNRKKGIQVNLLTQERTLWTGPLQLRHLERPLMNRSSWSLQSTCTAKEPSCAEAACRGERWGQVHHFCLMHLMCCYQVHMCTLPFRDMINWPYSQCVVYPLPVLIISLFLCLYYLMFI